MLETVARAGRQKRNARGGNNNKRSATRREEELKRLLIFLSALVESFFFGMKCELIQFPCLVLSPQIPIPEAPFQPHHLVTRNNEMDNCSRPPSRHLPSVQAQPINQSSQIHFLSSTSQKFFEPCTRHDEAPETLVFDKRKKTLNSH